MTFPAMSIPDAYARLTGPGAPFEIEEREIAGRRLLKSSQKAEGRLPE